jgi:hypothetical protein
VEALDEQAKHSTTRASGVRTILIVSVEYESGMFVQLAQWKVGSEEENFRKEKKSRL